MKGTGYSVQFTMPVDNPVNNVFRRRVKGWVTFDVPINFPNIHNFTFSQLNQLVELREKSPTVQTP